MNCLNNQENAIALVRGDDTNFGGQHLLTLNIRSDFLDLGDLKATFVLAGVQRNFYDLSSGQIVIDYSSVETSNFPVGIIYGDLKLISKSGKIATIENRLMFNVLTVVHGDSIATKPYETTINVEQGGQNILNIDVKTSIIQIQVGDVETLPAGSEAYVINRGDANDAVFDFGIPEGDGIKKIEKTGTAGLVDTYTITTETGKTTTYEVTNGSSIYSIEKTGTDVLTDTYTVTLTNGNTSTFEVTNGRGIVSISKTGTAGLVDTYTVLFNDNTSTTFNVTNGKDATINGVNALTLNATYGITLTQDGNEATISGKEITDVVDGISALIPAQATEQNKLADKEFVNSSIASNTGSFIGTFDSFAELEAYSGELVNNDYAFVVSTDSVGNTKYDRYKYTTATTPAGWVYEYTLNNSSFTADQWAAINSHATAEKVTQINTNKEAIGNLSNLTTTEKTNLVGAVNELDNDKQEKITGAATTVTSSNLIANRAMVSDANGKIAASSVTNAELLCLSGVASSVQTQLNGKASTSLDNLSANGQMIINTHNGTVSNCLLQIPQDIKLELSNGTLTLKSGSVLTYPNGNQYVTTADITYTQTLNRKWMVFYDGLGHIQVREPDHCYAGTTAPSDTGQTYMVWYDTTNNIIKYSNDSGATWNGNYSLPLAIITVSNGAISSIDRIFNGLGYMGEAIFALPGLKGLIPDGRNADGTLKSINLNATAVHVFVLSGTATRYILMNSVGGMGFNFDLYPGMGGYDPITNRVIRGSGAISSGQLIVGYTSYTNGRVDIMKIKIPEFVIDYNYFEETIDGVKSDFNTALSRKAGLSENNSYIGSNNFTGGSITVPTKNISDNSTAAASTAMVHNFLDGMRSNELTEIPQDIKLELSNGTLTLKSGSKPYLPNGTQIQTTSDLTATGVTGVNAKIMVAVQSNGSTLLWRNLANCVSGAGATAVNGFAYDTTANTVGYYSSTGELLAITTLPIAICTITNGVITSIDQVFNGFGYIGSSIFALPGVKGLIPNGKNQDGTLNSLYANNESLKVLNFTSSVTGYRYIIMGQNGAVAALWDLYPGNGGYDVEKNLVYRGSGSPIPDIIVGLAKLTSDRIDNFDIKNVFSLIDNNTLLNISGYDKTATQTLKNVNGVLTWVTDA